MATQNSASLPTNYGKNQESSTTGPAGSGDVCTNSLNEATAGNGIAVNHDLTLAAGVDIVMGTGVITGGAGAVTGGSGGVNGGTGGVTVGAGGLVLVSNPTVFHSGQSAPIAATDGTEKVAVTTESYVSEIFIPCNATITGIAVLNATAVAGNIQISLADSTGAIITAAQTASTAASGTAAYQQVPFAVAYAAKPGRYFVVLQCNNTGYKFRTHVLGNFAAGKLTGGTYGTFTTVASLIAAFVTGLGPICDTY